MADGLILTDVGAAKIEAAYEAGEVIVITMASFGDGGGSDVIADPSVTELVSMIGTAPLAADSSGEMFIGGTVVIRCEDYPGSVVREFGLESEDGTLIAYGAYPATYLPNKEDSIIKELVIKFVMKLVHAGCVTLIVDNSIVGLTVEEGDERYLNESENLADLADVDKARENLMLEKVGNYPAVPTAGGDVGYLDNAAHYGIKRGTWEGAGGYANQYTSPFAPFIVSPGYSAPKGSAQYQPMIKGIIQTDEVGFAAAVSFGSYTSGSGDSPRAVISVTCDDGAHSEWVFNPNNGASNAPGDVTSGKNVVAAHGVYESVGAVRVFSPNNPPPYPVTSVNGQGGAVSIDVGYSPNNKPSANDIGAVQQGGVGLMRTNSVMLGWDGSRLIGQVDNTTMGAMYCEFNPPPQQDLSPYATTDWVQQNFVSGVRQGSLVWTDRIFVTPIVPDGCSWVGADNNGSSDSSQMKAAYCPEQICINGAWFTISRIS